MRTRTKGFTLIECVTAVLISCVLACIGLPALSSLLHSVRARTAASDLQTAMAAARLQAVTSRAAVSICPSGDGLHCRADGVWDDGWIMFRDPARTGSPADPAKVARRWTPGGGVRVRASLARPLVRFLPDGAASGTNLTVTVCSGAAIQQVIVNNSGRARRERAPSAACS